MLILIFVHAKIILPRSFSLLLANLILACIFVSRSYMSVDRFGTLMLILVYMWKPKYFMWPSWNLKFLSRNLTLRWAQLGFYLIMLSSRIKIQFCGISMKLIAYDFPWNRQIWNDTVSMFGHSRMLVNWQLECGQKSNGWPHQVLGEATFHSWLRRCWAQIWIHRA